MLLLPKEAFCSLDISFFKILGSEFRLIPKFPPFPLITTPSYIYIVIAVPLILADGSRARPFPPERGNGRRKTENTIELENCFNALSRCGGGGMGSIIPK